MSASTIERTRGAALSLAGLLILFVGVPLLLAAATGSLSIPHNDAWAYSKIAQTFARTGHIQLLGWNRTALFGQVFVLGPLARSVVVQQIFVAATAAVALVACYRFLRVIGVDARSALFATAATGAVVDFGLLAVEYMSDMPGFAALMVTAWWTAYGVKRRSTLAIVGAVAVALWGFTVREQDAAAVAVALGAALLTFGGRRRWLAVVLCGVGAAVVLAFWIWRGSLGEGSEIAFTLSFRSMIDSSQDVVYTFALLMAPLAFLCAAPMRWRRRTQLIAGSVTALAVLDAARLGGHVFLGTSLFRAGATTDASVWAPQFFPAAVWLVLLACSCLTIGAFTGLLLERSFAAEPISVAMFGLLAVGTLAEQVLGLGAFSRYLFPLVPFLSAPLLLGTPVRRTVPGTAVLVAASVFGLLVTANGLAFDAAKWHAAERLMHRGVPARDIDPGLEWVGYHSHGPAELSRIDSGVDITFGWWEAAFADARDCYVISGSPLPKLTKTGTFGYERFAIFDSTSLNVYANPSCPTGHTEHHE